MQFMRPGQLDMIDNALAPVTADGTAAGAGFWEVSLSQCEESDTDHAAKWETSNMMFLYPDLVDMSELGTEPINLDMKPPYGIGGLDPREHASAQVGRRNVELAAEAIGKEAQRLLASLSEGQRSLNIKSISPEHWWLVWLWQQQRPERGSPPRSGPSRRTCPTVSSGARLPATCRGWGPCPA
jgi:chemotaxis receptor (MCP) glutamine deamidase CheD